jgi:hypothetical protein
VTDKEWGKTGYDDILKRYRIGKGHLYSIINSSSSVRIAKKLKVSREAIELIKKRHELILYEYKRSHS